MGVEETEDSHPSNLLPSHYDPNHIKRLWLSLQAHEMQLQNLSGKLLWTTSTKKIIFLLKNQETKFYNQLCPRKVVCTSLGDISLRWMRKVLHREVTNLGLVRVTTPSLPFRSKHFTKSTGPHKISALYESATSSRDAVKRNKFHFKSLKSRNQRTELSQMKYWPWLFWERGNETQESTLESFLAWVTGALFCFNTVTWMLGGGAPGESEKRKSMWPTMAARMRVSSNTCSLSLPGDLQQI